MEKKGDGSASRKITVAICVKNGGKTVGAAVASLCGQSVLPKKIIVVDDGSTDNTVEEIEKVRASREARESRDIEVEIIKNEGKGLYDGRNTALKHCGTEYLAFTDADCEADEKWIEGILGVFEARPEVAAGTGSHPQIGEANWVSRMHRLWFVIEGNRGVGYTDGLVGANSYFRTSVLREVGGWISLPLGNAEDFYISLKITGAGYKIWIDDSLKIYHHYTRSFPDLMKKSFNSGYAITHLMQKAGIKGFWYYYTLLIPVAALSALTGLCAGLLGWFNGWLLLAGVLGGTFLFNLRMFKSISMTLPRWSVRWVIIWGYSLGILKALAKKPA
jgi:glycosyltransferase involved in cell wall biosynthesis